MGPTGIMDYAYIQKLYALQHCIPFLIGHRPTGH